MRQYDEALDARFREHAEGAGDVVARSRFHPKDSDAGPLRRRLDLPHVRRMPGCVPSYQHAYPLDAGNSLRKELQRLGAQPLPEIRQAGYVAPWMSQTAYQPRPDRIDHDDHNDGNRLRRPRQRHDRRIADSRDDVQLETDQLGRQRRKALVARFRGPGLDDEVLAFDVAEVTEALPKHLKVPRFGGVAVAEIADAPNLARLLPLGGERRGEETAGEHADERPPIH